MEEDEELDAVRDPADVVLLAPALEVAFAVAAPDAVKEVAEPVTDRDPAPTTVGAAAPSVTLAASFLNASRSLVGSLGLNM